ncbi:MAG: hypothetical protein ABWZ40_07215 [Caulobacterales bacterium]
MQDLSLFLPLLPPFAARALGGQIAGMMLPRNKASVFGNCLAGVIGGSAATAMLAMIDPSLSDLVSFNGPAALLAEMGSGVLGGGALLILVGFLSQDKAA